MASRNWVGIVGTMLALIALYLILEHAAGATSVLSTLAAGTMTVFGTLQGRPVTAYGTQIGP